MPSLLDSFRRLVGALGAPQAVAADKVDFVTHIQPIFAARCAGCHGEKKAAGKLRLHRPRRLARLKRRRCWSPASRMRASCFKRIILPADDKKRMPKGGDPLSAEEIALDQEMDRREAPRSRRWPRSPPLPREAAKHRRSRRRKAAARSAAGRSPRRSRSSKQPVRAVMPLFGESPLLDVSFARAASPAGDDAIAALAGAADQIGLAQPAAAPRRRPLAGRRWRR